MACKYVNNEGINYTKYKQLAKENIVFWKVAVKLGYETANRMSIDELLEAHQALILLKE